MKAFFIFLIIYPLWGSFALAERTEYQRKFTDDLDNSYYHLLCTDIQILKEKENGIQMALRIAKASQDIPLTFEKTFELGHFYMSIKNYPKAYQYYKEAYIISKTLNQPLYFAYASSALGDIMRHFGKASEGVPLIQQALEIASKQNDEILTYEAYNRLGNLTKNNQNTESALLFYEKALRQAQQMRSTKLIIRAYNNLAVFYKNTREDYEQAERSYQLALQFAKAENLQEEIAVILPRIAILQRQSGHPMEALETCLEALDLEIHQHPSVNKAQLLGAMAHIYLTLDDYEKSKDFSYRAIEIYETYDNEMGIASQWNNLSLIYSRIGKPKEAMFFYEKLLQVDDNGLLKIMKYKASANRNVSSLYLNQGNIDKAIGAVKEAIHIDNILNNIKGMSASYLSLGRIYENTQEYKKAIEAYEQALTYSKMEQDSYGIARNSLAIAKLYYKLKDPKSEQGLLNAYKLASKIDNLSMMSQACQALMKTYKKQHNFKRAFKFAQRYYELKLQLVEKQSESKIEFMENKQKLQSKQSELERLKQDSQIQKLLLKQKSNELEAANRENLISELKIQKEQDIRNMFIGIAILALITLTLIYSRYQLSRKTQRELAIKNQRINDQNEDLTRLNNTKDKLFSIIGHDLRSPVGSLVSLLRASEPKMKDYTHEELQEFLNDVKGSIHTIYNLLENLLEWSLIQLERKQFNPRYFNLNDLIDDIIELIIPIAHGKEIKVNSILRENFQVFADENMVASILRNLIFNAIKFTPSKGDITLDAFAKDNFAYVEVRDTGIGISKSQIRTLFNKSPQLPTRGTNGEKGSGLGLLLCKELVEKNKGEIFVETRAGKGSVFCFSIPLTDIPDESESSRETVIEFSNLK